MSVWKPGSLSGRGTMEVCPAPHIHLLTISFVETSMEFATWEPVYEAILREFGYDRAADERARDRLYDLTAPFEDVDAPPVEDRMVVVAGDGPSLTEPASLEYARTAEVCVAASTAADRLVANDVPVDWVVTDLDKHPASISRFVERGTPVAVHAHGDNLGAVESVVPGVPAGSILPTTQAEPRGHVVNTGGFTDGDRAAFLADALGAASLTFVGWDFDDAVSEEKAHKLEWAARLLYWLECRRDERFDVLDGRRGSIETDLLPVD